jgi:putative endonuclease
VKRSRPRFTRRDSDPGSHRTPAQASGGHAESRAANYLARQGLAIVARNFNCRLGEIDLIARDGDVLVFVEVRMRSDAGFGGALESVTPRKQRRIAAAARMYLRQFSRPPCCRFDVVALEAEDVRWLKAAFECD